MSQMKYKLAVVLSLIALTILATSPLVAATVSTVVTAPAQFEDISVGPNGNLYMPSKPGGHVIYKVTPEGVLTTVITIGGSFPLGGAIGPDGTIFMSLFNYSQVRRINPNGSQGVVALGISGATGIAMANDPDFMFVASYNSNTVYSVNIATGAKTVVFGGRQLNGPDGLAVDGDGNLYMANFLDSRIHKITPAGSLSLLALLPGTGTGYIDYHDGTLYVAGLNTNKVYSVDADTGGWAVLAGTGVAGSLDGDADIATFTGVNGLAVSNDGQFVYVGESGRLRRIELDSAAPVRETPQAKQQLHGAAPNPFNPRTSIRFSLAVAGAVRLSIHDIRGHRIRMLHDGDLSAGDHVLPWDGQDVHGRSVASGTYLINMESSQGLETASMTLVR